MAVKQVTYAFITLNKSEQIPYSQQMWASWQCWWRKWAANLRQNIHTASRRRHHNSVPNPSQVSCPNKNYHNETKQRTENQSLFSYWYKDLTERFVLRLVRVRARVRFTFTITYPLLAIWCYQFSACLLSDCRSDAIIILHFNADFVIRSMPDFSDFQQPHTKKSLQKNYKCMTVYITVDIWWQICCNMIHT